MLGYWLFAIGYCGFAGLLLPNAHAQELELPDELLQSAGEWMQENLDDRAFDALGMDKQRVEAFASELTRRFQGDDVYDLAALKQTAAELIPVLQKFEETRPYAAWLQTHLDYFDMAEQLRQTVGRTNQAPSVRLPPPSPQLERSLWTRQLDKRPLPLPAQKYVPRLKQIFAAQKVPPELVWIAEVESSFNPTARSPVGAAGLFQLMPATARSLKLPLTPEDQRLHPEESARAAAQYLRYLYSRFRDWRLALAAYNTGPTRVEKLLNQHQARTYDAIASRLPAETQMYVPKVEATIRKREARALTELTLLKQ